MIEKNQIPPVVVGGEVTIRLQQVSGLFLVTRNNITASATLHDTLDPRGWGVWVCVWKQCDENAHHGNDGRS